LAVPEQASKHPADMMPARANPIVSAAIRLAFV